VSGPSFEKFDAPAVKDVAIEKWDEHSLGNEPNNLAAIDSLIGYRSYRYGKHLDLLITDQHSYRSGDAFSDPAVAAFGPEFEGMFPEDAAQILDGGRTFNGGKPPAEITFNDARVPNPRKDAPGVTKESWPKTTYAEMPPGKFDPVGLSFVGASLSSAGTTVRAAAPGGPLRYRVVHSAKLWAAGERPKLAQQVLDGDVGQSI